MDWALIRNLGIAIIAIGFVVLMISIAGENTGPGTFFVGVIILCIGYAMYKIGATISSNEELTSEITIFWTNKGCSIKEAEEQTPLTIELLKERNAWPEFDLTDLVIVSKLVKSLQEKK